MVYLAQNKGKVSSLRLISQEEGLSFSYSEKIISKLEKAGLVQSKKGSKGGYFISRPLNKIKLGEIVRALEGETALVKCLAEKGNCLLENKCFARKFWEILQKSLNSTMGSLTLADLIEEE